VVSCTKPSDWGPAEHCVLIKEDRGLVVFWVSLDAGGEPSELRGG
jgi:hypothetical protein